MAPLLLMLCSIAQKTLIKARYLPPNSDDGVFGEATEKATIQFQRDSFLKKRLNQPTQKFVDAPITFKGTDDGIVGPKTRNEMGIWDRSKWIQPIFEIHPDQYDSMYTTSGNGNRQDSSFVEHGLVCELQQTMQKIGAYQGYTWEKICFPTSCKK